MLSCHTPSPPLLLPLGASQASLTVHFSELVLVTARGAPAPEGGKARGRGRGSEVGYVCASDISKNHRIHYSTNEASTVKQSI